MDLAARQEVVLDVAVGEDRQGQRRVRAAHDGVGSPSSVVAVEAEAQVGHQPVDGVAQLVGGRAAGPARPSGRARRSRPRRAGTGRPHRAGRARTGAARRRCVRVGPRRRSPRSIPTVHGPSSCSSPPSLPSAATRRIPPNGTLCHTCRDAAAPPADPLEGRRARHRASRPAPTRSCRPRAGSSTTRPATR